MFGSPAGGLVASAAGRRRRLPPLHESPKAMLSHWSRNRAALHESRKRSPQIIDSAAAQGMSAAASLPRSRGWPASTAGRLIRICFGVPPKPTEAVGLFDLSEFTSHVQITQGHMRFEGARRSPCVRPLGFIRVILPLRLLTAPTPLLRLPCALPVVHHLLPRFRVLDAVQLYPAGRELAQAILLAVQRRLLVKGPVVWCEGLRRDGKEMAAARPAQGVVLTRQESGAGTTDTVGTVGAGHATVIVHKHAPAPYPQPQATASDQSSRSITPWQRTSSPPDS